MNLNELKFSGEQLVNPEININFDDNVPLCRYLNLEDRYFILDLKQNEFLYKDSNFIRIEDRGVFDKVDTIRIFNSSLTNFVCVDNPFVETEYSEILYQETCSYYLEKLSNVIKNLQKKYKLVGNGTYIGRIETSYDSDPVDFSFSQPLFQMEVIYKMNVISIFFFSSGMTSLISYQSELDNRTRYDLIDDIICTIRNTFTK